MHRLRDWGLSALVAAALIALSLWRSPPEEARQWLLLAGVWAVAAVVLHLLLHNRWMQDLDVRSRERLARWRGARGARAAQQPRAGAGSDGPAGSYGAGAAHGSGGAGGEVARRRDAGHATRRGAAARWRREGTRARAGRYDRRGRPLREGRR